MCSRESYFPNEEVIKFAQQVAYYAASLGVMDVSWPNRPCYKHIGALIADSVLQAGLNYNTVVYPRVKRILTEFPETRTLDRVYEVIAEDELSDFLMWTHPTKLDRFRKLSQYLIQNQIVTTESLRERLLEVDFQIGLLNIHGIGPKTVDYISCLCGIETIAVDRHVLTFAQEAKIDIHDYESVREIFSYAADLLDISRRNFDSWIWKTVSSR